MFREVSRALTDSIDDITRKWVDSLRTSERTEVHKQLLSAEIVDGVKGMLANLSQAIEVRELPEDEKLGLPEDSTLFVEATEPNSAISNQHSPLSTTPLLGPLEHAQASAAALGRLRHRQQYDINEVIYEYVRLRQEVWSALGAASLPEGQACAPSIFAYVDRMLDELMLVTIDNFYATSVRSLEKRAIGDSTTQLYNKDYFSQRLNEELRRAVRYGQSLSVVMLDLDNLKKINDTFGHQAGDEALRAVANAVRYTSRQTDVPCRYGGDEFVVILPETNKEQAVAFAHRVMNAVQSLSILVVSGGERAIPSQSEPIRRMEGAGSEKGPIGPTGAGGSTLLVPSPTVSIGVAAFPEDARNPETLLAKADDALYRAKKAGRNRVA